MTTLWVKTRAGYLTEGLQASSEDGSRAHLFRERVPLPDGLYPMARLSPRGVCPIPRLPSRLSGAPNVGFTSALRLHTNGGANP